MNTRNTISQLVESKLKLNESELKNYHSTLKNFGYELSGDHHLNDQGTLHSRKSGSLYDRPSSEGNHLVVLNHSNGKNVSYWTHMSSDNSKPTTGKTLPDLHDHLSDTHSPEEG